MATQGTICSKVPRAEAIARLNDQLRKTGIGGTIMITDELRRVTGFDPEILVADLANYDEFDSDNDPHGERDFGLISYKSEDVIWKVDYYDKSLEFGSEDPADPAVTSRVLVLMLARQW